MRAPTERSKGAVGLFIACNVLLFASLSGLGELDALNRGSRAAHYAYCTVGSAAWAQFWLSGVSRLSALTLWLLLGGALALSGRVRDTAVGAALVFGWVLGPRILANLTGCL